MVLSLFFLKFASDKFEECRTKIITTHGEKYADMKPFYAQENVFYLPEESRWSYIMENAKQDDIALKIDTALYTIEKNNPALKGALPNNYYSRLHIDTAKLGEMAANTFTNDQHKDLKADYIMANPPFNQKEWRGNDELIDDTRWNGYVDEKHILFFPYHFDNYI